MTIKIEKDRMTHNTLVEGNPLKPDDYDLIAQQATISVGSPVPDGWRVLSGNEHMSRIARIAYRIEIETEYD